eukprot:TRINITY_DN57093_c0_g1_i1.p1 TRINITY_DN57093_c0_g1~~TRINITY_DN57093_c0_g1_i1.p1  ORF type:complete len:250 (+),score=32.05 TRINITY_DN57093_c0_g1_i1:75-752(+)
MTVLANEAADSVGLGTVVDPACGTGALLLAIANTQLRSPAESSLRLYGRARDLAAARRCQKVMESAGFGDKAAFQQDGQTFEAIEDRSADVVACNLDNVGRKYSRSKVTELYTDILEEASRVLRPGGRCILLCKQPAQLVQAVAKGPWDTAGAWLVSRSSRRNDKDKEEVQLVSLERRETVKEEAESISLAMEEPEKGEADILLGNSGHLTKSQEIRAKWLRMGL